MLEEGIMMPEPNVCITCGKETEEILLGRRSRSLDYLVGFKCLRKVLQIIPVDIIRNDQELLNSMINICKISTRENASPSIKTPYNGSIKLVISRKHSYLLEYLEDKMEVFLNLINQSKFEEATNLISQIPKHKSLPSSANN
jgi:hypothetical protein